jgi:hypothetical protein
MSKYRITFSYNYEEEDCDWDENPVGSTTTFEYSDEIEVEGEMTIEKLFELKEKASKEDYGSPDAYTDIQIEKIE